MLVIRYNVVKGDDHLNNIIEIVNKIKKDPKKLKRLIEIEKIEELYQLFRENGYAHDFNYFQVKIMYILETNGWILTNLKYDDASGGKNLKNNFTKILSASMASLLTLSSPYGLPKAKAESARDHFFKTTDKICSTLPYNDGIEWICGLGIGIAVPCAIGGLIYKAIRDSKRRMAELAEHRIRMSSVLQRIITICYGMEPYYEKLLDIAKIEPAVKGLLDQCIACLYYFREAFFDGEVPYIIRSENVNKEYKKSYTYDSQRYNAYIKSCTECAQKYRDLANRYSEPNYPYQQCYSQYPNTRTERVSVNVNVYNAQTPNSVFPTDNNRMVNNTNMPCNKEQCEEWAKLIDQVIELANCIMHCERSSPIRFKYVAPPPPPPPTPKPQTLSPGAQSGGRNFSRY